MIIDIHTHTFPEAIAEKTLAKLAALADSKPYVSGTNDGLSESMSRYHVDRSVILPVVTSPKQCETINRVACEVNEKSEETGLYSFGGIHPDCENYREILKGLAANGIRGIKLHPAYQKVDFDDLRFIRIVEAAAELDLAITVHAGWDIGIPEHNYSDPDQILKVYETVRPKKLILAHMGGWEDWDAVEEKLVGKELYLDTSFSLTKIRGLHGTERDQMKTEQFVRMVRAHGAERVLMGSDSPWADQYEAIDALLSSGLTDDELHLILGENARKLLFADEKEKS